MVSSFQNKQSTDLFSTLKETAELGISGFRETVSELFGGSSNSGGGRLSRQGVSVQGQISHGLEHWERNYIKETSGIHG